MTSFDVKLTTKDIFRFNIYQAYRGTQGIISVLLPIAILFILWKNRQDFTTENMLVYAAIAIILLVYMPISLYLRSKAAFKKNKALANPLHFEFTEENIQVSQGEQSVELKWENVYKFVPSKNALLLYTNRVHAYILPKEQIGEQTTGLVQLAQKKLDGVRCRIK